MKKKIIALSLLAASGAVSAEDCWRYAPENNALEYFCDLSKNKLAPVIRVDNKGKPFVMFYIYSKSGGYIPKDQPKRRNETAVINQQPVKVLHWYGEEDSEAYMPATGEGNKFTLQAFKTGSSVTVSLGGESCLYDAKGFTRELQKLNRKVAI